MTTYFAYGSNLCDVDWADFCRSLGVSSSCMQPLEPAWLPDMELVSNHFSTSRGGGALNVQAAVGSVVPGMLFEVSQEGWEVLRRKEGARSRVYDEISTTALLLDGREKPVTTFVLNPNRRRPEVVPMTEAYLSVCRRGYQRFGLDERFLDAAARGEHAPSLEGVFVYGTLMRQERRSSLVASHKIVCALLAEVSGRLEDCGDYPGLILSGEATVHGEFYRFEDIASFLADADRVEGFRGFGDTNNLFRRALIEAAIGDGRTRLAWAYVYCRPSRATIPSGSWRAHRNNLDAALGRIIDAHAAQRADFWKALHAWETRFCANPSEAVLYDRVSAIKALADQQLSERAVAGVSAEWVAAIRTDAGSL